MRFEAQNQLVSVVMAVYNCQKYLSCAIESILDQTFVDFEFIIADDASTDNSLDIIRNYASRDPRVRVVANSSNLGLTNSLNKAVKLASGSFIARMDGDDVAYQNRLAKQISFMIKNPEYVCIGAQAHIIDEDGDIIEEWLKPTQSGDIKRKLLLDGGGQIIHPLAVFTRAAFEEVGGYDPRYAISQDYDLLLRLAEIGELGNLSDFLLKYRRHKGAITSSKRNAQINYAIKALLECYDRRAISIDQLIIPDVAYPSIGIPYHLDYARKALSAGNNDSARKHAFQAKASLSRYSVLWFEMTCIINPSRANKLVYGLLVFFTANPLTARLLKFARRILAVPTV